MAILTIAQVLITSSKLLCSIRKFGRKKIVKNWKKIFIFFGKNEKKYFLVEIIFWSSSAEDDLWKTTWQKISLPWCFSYFNITFTFTPLSSNCSNSHCCNPSISSRMSLWQRYLLSCAFGQLKRKKYSFNGSIN